MFLLGQLGEVLLDPDVYPQLNKEQLTDILVKTEWYSRAEIDAAVSYLFSRPTKLGPVGGGTFYYATPVDFDDLAFALSQNVPIAGFDLRVGDIIDRVQTLYGSGQWGPPHGGDGGSVKNIRFEPGDILVSIEGRFGPWFGSIFIQQLTFVTRSGKRFGPFGWTRADAQPFSLVADRESQLIALFGQTVLTLRAGAPPSPMVNKLGVYQKCF